VSEKYLVEPREGLYVCPECGCADVEGTAWVHLNSGKDTGGDPPLDDYWCPACQEHYGRVEILGSGDPREPAPFTLVMPDDEKAHPCFDVKKARPLFCQGDGWWRCRECACFKPAPA
jgi:hypothetical protein